MSDTSPPADFLKVAYGLAPGSPYIELYSLDASSQGAGTIFWTPGPAGAANVMMGGIPYTPVPIESSGFEWNGQGTLPTPTLKISNVTGDVMGLLQAHNDCLGCVVTRMRTFVEFLDGQPSSDPTAMAIPDVYRVERKSHADKFFVELELAAFTDVQGRQLPFRVILQGACTRTYRTYNPATNAFIQGTCPYSGSSFWDITDTSQTDPSKDMCSRKLLACQNRFGKTATLPTYQFPGVAITSF